MLTAVVVAFPEISTVVDGWRERTCADRTSIGIPPHVTLLFPFMPAEQVGTAVLDDLRDLIATVPGFDVVLRETRRFPGTLYLAPEPAEPFVGLTQSIAGRWPDYPPYGGEFDTIIPHVTDAHGDASLLDEAEADVEPKLPIEATVREAFLLEELESNWVRWSMRARFPLRQTRA